MRADTVAQRAEKRGKVVLGTSQGEHPHLAGLKGAESQPALGGLGRAASFFDLLFRGVQDESESSTVREKRKGKTESRDDRGEDDKKGSAASSSALAMDATKLGLLASQQRAASEQREQKTKEHAPLDSAMERMAARRADTKSEKAAPEVRTRTGSENSRKDTDENSITDADKLSPEALSLLREGLGKKNMPKEEQGEHTELPEIAPETNLLPQALLKDAATNDPQAVPSGDEGKTGKREMTGSGNQQGGGAPDATQGTTQQQPVATDQQAADGISASAGKEPQATAAAAAGQSTPAPSASFGKGKESESQAGGVAPVVTSPITTSTVVPPASNDTVGDPSLGGAPEDGIGGMKKGGKGPSAIGLIAEGSKAGLQGDGGIQGHGAGLGTTASSPSVGIGSLGGGFRLENAGAQARTTKTESVPPQRLSKAVEQVEAAMKDIVRGKQTKMVSLRLDPPSLGKVQVDVSLKNGTLHARLVPESPDVANALRDRSHELHGALRKLGLAVDTVVVSVATGEHQSQFTGSAWSGSQGGRHGGSFDSPTEHESVAPPLLSHGEEEQPPQPGAAPRDYWVA